MRLDEIKEQKTRETETIMIGDSNLKMVNSNAILADVVASSGAKIGHIANQMDFENLDNYKNLVVFCGINNIPAMMDTVDADKMWAQVKGEQRLLEDKLRAQVVKGKNVMITPVPRANHTQISTKHNEMRSKINQGYLDMQKRLRIANKQASVEMLSWTEDRDNDFENGKAISESAVIKMLQAIDQKLKGKLRATYLDTKLTAEQPYAKVQSTYPLGCRKCTTMGHSEDTCSIDLSKKRNLSSKDEEAEPAHKIANMKIVD